MDDFADLDLDLDLDGVDDLPVDPADTDLPDPIDAGDITFGGTAISGGSAVEAVDSDDLIISADGTGYDSYSNYVGGTDPHRPV